MSETFLWPYTERNGVNASEDVDSLLRDPEVYLDEQEKAGIYAFASDLFDGHINEYLHVDPLTPGEPIRDLQEIDNTSTVASHQSFYIDYFKTESAQADVETLSLELEGEVSIREQLYRLAINPGGTEPKIRKEIAARSLNWYKQELANRLRQPKEHDALQPDCEVVNVDFNPDKFFKKFNELQAYRSFYRNVSRALKDVEPTAEKDAKLTVLHIYFARVNALVAEMYPHMHDLSRQIEYMPLLNDKFNDWRYQLLRAAPIVADVKKQVAAEREAQISSHLRRLDLLRFGAAQREGEANYSPISREVDQLATELSEAEVAEIEGTAHLSSEVIDYMRETRWNATQMKQFCEAVLSKRDILSEHQTDWNDVNERSGYAADEKWQVIISPKVTSLSVNGKKKTVTVPEKYDRSLSQVAKAGALPGAAHELSHIWQHEYSFELAKTIPLAKIKGKRYITGFEMGGVQQERELHTMIGQIRPTNVTYLRALQAKLRGGNQTEAARAFAEAMGDEMTPAIAKTAGEDSLRVSRGGGYSSQALDYIEQELLLRSMADFTPGQVRAVAIAGGTFSIRDAAALHRFGLMELPGTVRQQPAEDVMQVFLQDFYPGEIE
jgi:hypothetical protein